MSEIKLILQRDVMTHDFTLGRLIVNGATYGYTCEDTDRLLEENPGAKIKGKTAIPRGLYRMMTSMSQRFGRLMPEVKGVPGYSGVRIHSGNTAADTEGCPLLGSTRTATGVIHCAEINQSLIDMLVAGEARADTFWLEVK